MKIFVSWSGESSHGVALALKEWIPGVINAIVPYVSSEDIDKGARWAGRLAEELEGSNFGIICVTPDNVSTPWINFEAGALSKLEQSRVTPFLFGMSSSELTGPLLHFQATRAERADVLRLMRDINEAAGNESISNSLLDRAFEVWWPDLDRRFAEVRASLAKHSIDSIQEVKRSVDDVLDEVLQLVRSQQRILRSPQDLLPPAYLAQLRHGFGVDLHGHPLFFDLSRRFNTLKEALNGDLEPGDALRKSRVAAHQLEGIVRFLINEFVPGIGNSDPPSEQQLPPRQADATQL
jgi:hypothetical protein